MGGRSTWSPDGTRLAFYRGPSGDRDIFVINVDGTGLERLTDGGDNLGPTWSPDGNWIVLRSRSALMFYRSAELLGGQARPAFTTPVASLKEPQGEGVALGADNTVFVAGEGGGKGQPGTFAHLTCALPN